MRLNLDVQKTTKKNTQNVCVNPLIKILKLMIGRASQRGQAFLLPSDKVGHQSRPVPLAGSEVKTVQEFSYFFSYKTNSKRRLGKDLGQRALKANISAEKQTLT